MSDHLFIILCSIFMIGLIMVIFQCIYSDSKEFLTNPLIPSSSTSTSTSTIIDPNLFYGTRFQIYNSILGNKLLLGYPFNKLDDVRNSFKLTCPSNITLNDPSFALTWAFYEVPINQNIFQKGGAETKSKTIDNSNIVKPKPISITNPKKNFNILDPQTIALREARKNKFNQKQMDSILKQTQSTSTPTSTSTSLKTPTSTPTPTSTSLKTPTPTPTPTPTSTSTPTPTSKLVMSNIPVYIVFYNNDNIINILIDNFFKNIQNKIPTPNEFNQQKQAIIEASNNQPNYLTLCKEDPNKLDGQSVLDDEIQKWLIRSMDNGLLIISPADRPDEVITLDCTGQLTTCENLTLDLDGNTISVGKNIVIAPRGLDKDRQQWNYSIVETSSQSTLTKSIKEKEIIPAPYSKPKLPEIPRDVSQRSVFNPTTISQLPNIKLKITTEKPIEPKFNFKPTTHTVSK